jgi:hypothetical protein
VSQVATKLLRKFLNYHNPIHVSSASLFFHLNNISLKVKVKQSRYRPKGPRGFQEVMVPRFHDTAQDSGKVVSLTHGRLYPQEMLLVRISVRG